MAGQAEAVEGFLALGVAAARMRVLRSKGSFFCPTKAATGVGGHCCRLLVGWRVRTYITPSLQCSMAQWATSWWIFPFHFHPFCFTALVTLGFLFLPSEVSDLAKNISKSFKNPLSI